MVEIGWTGRKETEGDERWRRQHAEVKQSGITFLLTCWALIFKVFICKIFVCLEFLHVFFSADKQTASRSHVEIVAV